VKLVIEVDIVTDIPEQAHGMFAEAAVESLRRNLDGNTIIEEALNAGALYGRTATVGRRTISVQRDDPTIYGVKE
jgi:hypothetical protein